MFGSSCAPDTCPFIALKTLGSASPCCVLRNVAVSASLAASVLLNVALLLADCYQGTPLALDRIAPLLLKGYGSVTLKVAGSFLDLSVSPTLLPLNVSATTQCPLLLSPYLLCSTTLRRLDSESHWGTVQLNTGKRATEKGLLSLVHAQCLPSQLPIGPALNGIKTISSWKGGGTRALP
ncbi:hypothetical protein NDU88_002651 [Pleurodeles waltl]|uniref:Uncharacterized protein n=1 Tax=Pleurodeles waltl TaxID=8319 RepID=A0AAV7LG95_PLEWA|nr:hypothetical protein NDU88_002651 [Pleurodeles waltl]